MNMNTKRTALVLGATGGIGGEIANALLTHGWAVRGLARDPAKAAANVHGGNPQVKWLAGDAMVQADVVGAAEGTQLIVHAVNPPGYRDWDKLVLPMIDNSIAAARAAGGARTALPGTVYNFDAANTPLLGEDSPQNPVSHKGAIRKELEARLEGSALSGDVPVLILRAGDFFGPRVRSSWFAQAMVTPGKPVTRLTLLNRNIGHSWAYLPDLAETFARLLDAPERLRAFERVQFEGFWDPDGAALPAAVAAALGQPHLPIRSFPWWLMRLAAPIFSFPREAVDILPTWRHAIRLDNSRLVELLGREPRTPILKAMRTTLEGLKCLPASAAALRLQCA
jgi:nucleoside-diphosphate-sugar epimerase